VAFDGPRASPNAGVVIVSNRMPVRIVVRDQEVELHRSSGGLAAALSSLTDIRAWVGWPGGALDEAARPRVVEAMRDQRLQPVFLDAEQERSYYDGMCNSVLWPLLHYFPGKVDLRESHWRGYVAANHRFTEATAEAAKPGDFVWVHDFHLMLVPSQLRALRPDLRIGFFLHVPFPSSELWRLLPQREALLRGLLGADLIAFHTADYLRHFRNSCLRVLGIDTSADAVPVGTRSVKLGAHPVGTDVERFQKALASPEVARKASEFDATWKQRRLVLGVERLDYTKGVPAKFRAYERYLQRDRARARDTVMLQVLVPSREENRGYRELLHEIEKEVGRINGELGTPGTMPLEFVHRSLDDAELVALYRRADALLVAPVRDGMNLVAQEFVLCQGHGAGTADHARGMLVLSEFAGAAMSLPHALLVNPWDAEAMADAIEAALCMSPAERRWRIADMHERVLELNSRSWARSFLQRLERAAAENHRERPAVADRAALHALHREFQAAPHRVLLIDYDGTLRELEVRPELAAPTPAIRSLVRRLAEAPSTSVHIVSGRRRDTLAHWFEDLPVWLGAEHGYHRRDQRGNWSPTPDVDLSWMPGVRELLTKVVAEVPGSFLEIKSCALAWHYRLADPAYGPWRARELATMLQQFLAGVPAEPLLGRQVVEVRAAGADKGSYVAQALASVGDSAFVLCAGDDRTDFDMYRRLPGGARICHVGAAVAGAHVVVETPADCRDLLAGLLDGAAC
jgi:trehalose 6-phosphate synthase/phosphatase